MLTVVSVLGTLAVFAFVLAPLWRARATEHETGTPVEIPANGQTLLEQRDAALAALAELDFDRSLGNLSEADYEALRTQYRAQAIGIFRTLHRQPGPSNSKLPVQHSTPLDAPGAAKLTHQSARSMPIRSIHEPFLWSVGVITAGLLVVIELFMLFSSKQTPASDTPRLDVLHTHAMLLVPGTEVALIGHHNGLLRSADSGRTWTSVPGVTGDVLSLAAGPGKSSTLFLAGPGQIRRSEDTGRTWEALTIPQPTMALSAVAVGEAGNNMGPLYAAVADVGLYQSSDGQAWRLAGGGLPADVTTLILRPGPYSALYAASPTEGVLASGDQGQTWGSANGIINGALPTLAVRALAVDPASGDQYAAADGTVLTGTLYAATDRGLFKSIDGGASWSGLPLTLSLAAVSARSVPSPLLLAVDSRSRVWRSTDRGGNWQADP